MTFQKRSAGKSFESRTDKQETKSTLKVVAFRRSATASRDLNFACDVFVSRWLVEKIDHSQRKDFFNGVARNRSQKLGRRLFRHSGVHRNTKIGRGLCGGLAQDKNSLLNLFGSRHMAPSPGSFAIDRHCGKIWPIISTWELPVVRRNARLHSVTLTLSSPETLSRLPRERA